MKARAEHIPSGQLDTLPRTSAESSTGGFARQVDNRPATLQRQKLRAAMAEGQNAPIQGKWYKWEKTSDRKFIDKVKNTPEHEMKEVKIGTESQELSDHLVEPGIEKLADTRRIKRYYQLTNEKYSTPMSKSRLRTTNYYRDADVATYKVTDPAKKFYHSTRLELMPSIQANGLDHMHGYDDVDFTERSVRRHTRGYVYFGLKAGTARGYGRKHLDGGHRLLSFTLDEGDVFECDPELSSAGRIDKTIPPEQINVMIGGREVPLTEYEIPRNVEQML